MNDITLQQQSFSIKNQYPQKQSSPSSTLCQKADSKKVLSQYSQQQDYLTLSEDFFTNLSILQQRYSELPQPKWQSQLFHQLIQAYTDCVSYFQDRGQIVSQYFQTKIKKMLQSIKKFAKKNKGEITKSNINSNILKQMQKEDVGTIINRQQQKIQNTKKNIDQILRNQQDRIEQRRRKKKSKASLFGTRSHSMMTFSVQSLSSVDSPLKNAKNRQNRIKNTEFLFTKQILSQDDEDPKNGQSNQ